MSQTALARYELTARPGAASRVLALCDDPRSSAESLSSAIGTDPLFAAKVLRIANSAYYGLSGRVSTLTFAVSVMGFQGVRSLAVLAAAGLDNPDGAPDGFWEAAALCATGAEMVAPIVGADSGDAFIVGLLHMVGSALMHQKGDEVEVCLPELPSPEQRQSEERSRYGVTHDELAALAMAEWHFPPRIHEVVGRHHRPVTPDAPALERTLYIARALVGQVLSPEPASDFGCAWLSEGLIGQTQGEALIERMKTRAEALLEGLRPSG